MLSAPGKPDPLAWAKATTDMIVRPAPEAKVERVVLIAALRRQIAWRLADQFRGLQSTDLPGPAADEMWYVIWEIVKSTEWSFMFTATPVRDAVRDVLLRNARSYIDILGT
jgi:hypothetical protein